MSLKNLSVFVFITVCNLLLFTYNIPDQKEKYAFACSVYHRIESLSRFISFNGEKSFLSLLPEICSSNTVSDQNIEVFKQAFKDVTYKCSQQRSMSLEMEIRKPILTLFTSLNPSKGKNSVYNTTIQNWSTFLPKINLILFTNDTAVRKFCESRGWTVFPITRHAAGGVPVLKTMFETAMKAFDTPFYGFSNADILFTDKLLETLVVALKDYGNDNKILLTGRRYNIPMLTPKETASYENIRTAVKTRGELFIDASEDFFIATKTFDWSKVPDLVIGRPAYDNWLVAHARCTGNTVIDVTSTVMCAHQTTTTGNMDGWENKFTEYNGQLLQKLNMKRDYNKGYISCPEIKTFFNLCGNIKTIRRHHTPDYCKC